MLVEMEKCKSYGKWEYKYQGCVCDDPLCFDCTIWVLNALDPESVKPVWS